VDSWIESRSLSTPQPKTSWPPCNGTRVDSTYDAEGRPQLESVTPAAGVVGELYAQFAHDALGRLTLASNAGSAVTREYDSLSQLSAEVLNGKRTQIRTSGNGYVQGFTYPGGRAIGHTRDGLGRLKTVREQGASVDVSRLEYRGLGAIKSRAYANGTATTYQYDAILRTLDVSHTSSSTTLARRSSTWDRQSNRVTRQNPGQSPVRTFTGTYDSVGRMVRSERVGGGQTPQTIQYALDDVGNRTSVVGGPDAGTYAMSATDAPQNLYTSTPLGTSTYDLNGSLKSRASSAHALAYDYRERLVEYHDVGNGRLHVYGYDALGWRYKKVTDSGTPQLNETRYFFDGGWNVLEERDEQDQVVATYVREDGLDTLVEIARDASGAGNFQTWAVHADDLNSVVALSNVNGGLVEEYEYRDYGEVVNAATMQPLGGSVVGNTTFFTGRELDGETGLYQYRHRYLDPSAGRFVSRDPLGTWGDAANLGNAQAYCGNNPWSRVDPLGLDCAYPAALLPPSIRGDCRKGSTDREGVKGDCEHHGSASGKQGKSGERISDAEYASAERRAAGEEILGRRPSMIDTFNQNAAAEAELGGEGSSWMEGWIDADGFVHLEGSINGEDFDKVYDPATSAGRFSMFRDMQDLNGRMVDNLILAVDAANRKEVILGLVGVIPVGRLATVIVKVGGAAGRVLAGAGRKIADLFRKTNGAGGGSAGV